MVLRKKSKVIFFRVSEEEFVSLERTRAEFGIRSLSDFARLSIKHLIASQENDLSNDIADELEKVGSILNALEEKVQRLARADRQTRLSEPRNEQ